MKITASMNRKLEELEERIEPPLSEMDLINELQRLEGIMMECGSCDELDPETQESMKKYDAVFGVESEVVETLCDGSMHQRYEESSVALKTQRSQDVTIQNTQTAQISEVSQSKAPDNYARRNGPFRKEWVQDSQGNWFLQTQVDLSEVEMPPTRRDSIYEAALQSCYDYRI